MAQSAALHNKNKEAYQSKLKREFELYLEAKFQITYEDFIKMMKEHHPEGLV